MDLLAGILSGILVCGTVGVIVTVALRVLRAVRRRKWSGHHAHVLTDSMVHYRANVRMMNDAVKPAA